MTDKVLIDCHDDALKLARDGLFGGRNECFFIGQRTGQFYQLDINSSYAAVMWNTLMPVQLRGYSEHSSVNELSRFVVDKVCVADVVVHTDVPIYPLRQEHQLLFPVGRFKTVLCGSELQHALSHDDVERVYRVAVYDGAFAFRDYMKSLWDERRKARSRGEEAESERWKLLMASFFGKWSQRGRRWENVGDADDESIHYWIDIDADTRAITEYRQFGGIVQRCVYESESRDSSPAISACITAGARLSLWWLMQLAGRDHVYYVDTDSILVDDVGFGRVAHDIDDAQLGGLHCEGEYTDIQIYGPKHYRLDARWRHAGVRETALRVDESHIVQNENLSFTESLRLGESQRAISYQVAKAYAKAYTKGNVQEDGFVKPIQLEMKL